MSHQGGSRSEARRRVREIGIIPVLRGDFPQGGVIRVARVLIESGIPILEVTLNSPGALASIEALSREFAADELLVGAGTVRTPQQAEQAFRAGARLIVSPNLELDAIRVCRERDVLHLPGVLTPSEAHQAAAAGCRMVKLFPADVFGPAYLRALLAPLDDLEPVPSGGITPANLGSFRRAGAVAAAVGGALVAGPDQPDGETARRAAAFLRSWRQAHGE